MRWQGSAGGRDPPTHKSPKFLQGRLQPERLKISELQSLRSFSLSLSSLGYEGLVISFVERPSGDLKSPEAPFEAPLWGDCEGIEGLGFFEVDRSEGIQTFFYVCLEEFLSQSHAEFDIKEPALLAP